LQRNHLLNNFSFFQFKVKSRKPVHDEKKRRAGTQQAASQLSAVHDAPLVCHVCGFTAESAPLLYIHRSICLQTCLTASLPADRKTTLPESLSQTRSPGSAKASRKRTSGSLSQTGTPVAAAAEASRKRASPGSAGQINCPPEQVCPECGLTVSSASMLVKHTRLVHTSRHVAHQLTHNKHATVMKLFK
jgi:Zinc finger, C2H2 type